MQQIHYVLFVLLSCCAQIECLVCVCNYYHAKRSYNIDTARKRE